MIFLAVLLFVTTLVGGVLANFFVRRPSVLRYFLVFTGAYLLTLVLLHFLPALYVANDSMMLLSLCVLAGFMLQHYLEQLSGGIEHGHMLQIPLARGIVPSICFGLGIHALIEGMVLINSRDLDSYALFMGIVGHKIPASFALVVALQGAGLAYRTLVIVVLGFALVSPMGMLLGMWGQPYLTGQHVSMPLAGVAGILLHVATRMLLEGTPNHKYDAFVNLATLVGVGMGLLQYLF